MGNGKVRSVGIAMAMQGSCISNVDVGSATVKLADDGTFNLIIGAADMGTGCDTILAQMVAECMDCSVDDIVVHGVDTDIPAPMPLPQPISPVRRWRWHARS